MFVDEKQQGEPQTAEQANRKLKLSEAIRIGAAKRPQAVGKYFKDGASCALGAAYEAVTGKYVESGSGGLPNMIKWFEDHFEMDDWRGMDITERNDRGVSREQIADWLESQGY